jgi:hypothetical protein
VRRDEVKRFSQEIEPILDRYEEHPAIVAALTYIDDLIQGRGQSSREELEVLHRIHNAGVTPRDALLSLLGVWGCARYHKLDDGIALSSNLGNAFFLLVPRTRSGTYRSGQPRYRNNRPALYRPFGRRLRDVLGPLLARLWDIYEAEDQRHRDQRFALAPARVADLGADIVDAPEDAPKEGG